VVSQGGTVERVATLTTIDFHCSTDRLDSFLFLRRGRETVRIVVIPSLKVAEAKLSFGVFLITSSLAGFLLFDFHSHVRFPQIDSMIHYLH
jgi:hypothetical protein